MQNHHAIKVSILIAARNEEHNIVDCLEALHNLSYTNLQILIGDDDSEDKTAQLAEHFIKDKPHFQLIKIKPERNAALKGKANVLAQLAHDATGEYLFYTDADIEVPTDWVQNMLCHFAEHVGIVVGITTIKVQTSQLNLLAVYQALEWLFYLSIMRVFYLFNTPITAMGNNMAIRREVYDAVGGFEKIPFSITEDYEIFKAILGKGYQFIQLYDRRVLALSKPIESWPTLMIQRKRWMHGANSLPIGLRLAVMSNGLILPILLILFLLLPKIGVLIALVSYIITTMWLMGCLSWLQQKHLFLFAPFFWFYQVFINFAMLINFFSKKETTWKGRTY